MPASEVVTVRISRAKLTALLHSLPRVLAGKTSTATNLQKALLVRIGITALRLIYDDFLIKSRGGTGAGGERWKPLSPHTIAYHRRHKVIGRTGTATTRYVPKQSRRAGDAPSWILTNTQRSRWWKVYSSALARFKGDKVHAGRYAWTVLKAEGARTMISVYGGLPAEILRDTGLLLNSLKPAVAPSAARTSSPEVPQQVFRLAPGEVTIGTRRAWAWTHHEGIPGKIPQRRLWPPLSRWPSDWWQQITRQGSQAIVEYITDLLS